MKLRLIPLFVLLIALGPPLASAQETDVAAALEIADKAKAEVAALQQELMSGFTPELSAEEQQKLMEKYVEAVVAEVQPKTREVLQAVKDVASDAKIVSVLTWIVQTDPGSETAAEAMALLMKHHTTNPEVLSVVQMFQYAPMSWTIPTLRKLAEQDLPEQSIRDTKLALAQALTTLAQMPAMMRNLPDHMRATVEFRMGKAHLESLQDIDVEATEEEAIALYRAIGEQYGDQEIYGQSVRQKVESAIFQLENLSVGKLAPEIEGEDIDGVSFKLSDYRGKVVMLDFWGDW